MAWPQWVNVASNRSFLSPGRLEKT